MTRYKRSVCAALTVLAVAAAVGLLCRSSAQDRAVAADKDKDPPPSPEMEAVRKTADAFTKAFNAGDAQAVAAFWTKDGEFVGADGDTLRGRHEIEKSYAEFFKSNPKAAIAVNIPSVRLLARPPP